MRTYGKAKSVELRVGGGFLQDSLGGGGGEAGWPSLAVGRARGDERGVTG